MVGDPGASVIERMSPEKVDSHGAQVGSGFHAAVSSPPLPKLRVCHVQDT